MPSYTQYKRQVADASEADIETWITVKGNHIPIMKGQSKEEAVKAFIEKKSDKESTQREHKPVTLGEATKKVVKHAGENKSLRESALGQKESPDLKEKMFISKKLKDWNNKYSNQQKRTELGKSFRNGEISEKEFIAKSNGVTEKEYGLSKEDADKMNKQTIENAKRWDAFEKANVPDEVRKKAVEEITALNKKYDPIHESAKTYEEKKKITTEWGGLVDKIREGVISAGEKNDRAVQIENKWKSLSAEEKEKLIGGMLIGKNNLPAGTKWSPTDIYGNGTGNKKEEPQYNIQHGAKISDIESMINAHADKKAYKSWEEEEQFVAEKLKEEGIYAYGNQIKEAMKNVYGDVYTQERKAESSKKWSGWGKSDKSESSGWVESPKFEKLTEKYMPKTGEADNELGEALRSINQAVYRYYNDGDMYNKGYGKETVNWAIKHLTGLAKNKETPRHIARGLENGLFEMKKYGMKNKDHYETALKILLQTFEFADEKDIDALSKMKRGGTKSQDSAIKTKWSGKWKK